MEVRKVMVEMETRDVVILGAGAAGSWAAWRAAGEGVEESRVRACDSPLLTGPLGGRDVLG